MTTRTADSGPTRETLRSYLGGILATLKAGGASEEDLRAVLAELLPPALPSHAGEAIKEAPDGFYWAHYGKGKAEGHWTAGRLKRSNVRSGVDLDFTDPAGSDYRLNWWLQSSDGSPAGEFEHTEFCEHGITLYGPLVPPNAEGAR